MKNLQLTWGTWSEVCDFIPKDIFIKGTFMDGTKPVDYCTNTIGLELNINDKYTLVNENDWIIKDDIDNISILSDIKYKRSRILENI
jgi:hypothetical protein